MTAFTTTTASAPVSIDTTQAHNELHKGDRVAFEGTDGTRAWGHLIADPRPVQRLTGNRDYSITLVRDGVVYRRWAGDAARIVRF